MSTKKFLIGILAIIGLAAIALLLDYIASKTKNPNQPNPAQITGQIIYLERIALLPDSLVEVTLKETDSSTQETKDLAKFTHITSGENVPLPFSITYDQNDIIETNTYSLEAKIFVNNDLRWTNTNPVYVLTNENASSDIEILVNGIISEDKEELQSENISLAGKKYILTKINNEDIPADANLNISFTENSITGKFCNNMSGTYELDKNNIKGMMISTLMLCQNPSYIMQSENAFSKMMSTGAQISQTENTLTLKDNQNTLVFKLN